MAFISSAERAVRIQREVLITLLTSIVTLVGLAEIAAFLTLHCCPTYFWDTLPILDRYRAYTIFFGLATLKVVTSNYDYYFNHMYLLYLMPAEIKSYQSSTFLRDNVVLKDKSEGQPNHFHPVPEVLHLRGMSLYGMTRLDFLYNVMTIGPEYVRNYLVRIFKMYGRIEPYNRRITTHHDFYLAMINTSMICWMNLDSGHLEFTNMHLYYNGADTIDISYCRIELDHDAQKFVRMFIKTDGDNELCEVADQTAETCEEAAIIAMVIISVYAHPHVHFWANGVAQLTKTKDPNAAWTLAKESNDVTQFMNAAGIFSSGSYVGTSVETMTKILKHNLNQGLPMHFRKFADHGPYMTKVISNSNTHKINGDCRSKISSLHPEWPDDIFYSLMAASLYHSADHYYMDKLCGSQPHHGS